MVKKLPLSQNMVSLIQMLKFRKRVAHSGDCTYLSDDKISSITGVKPWKIRSILKQNMSLEQLDHPKQSKRMGKITQEHIDYLSCKKTLQQWKSFSLSRRCVAFHRQFPEIRLTASALRRVYLSNKIRYKRMIETKHHSNKKKQEIIQQRLVAYRELILQHSHSRHILYLDETLFKPYGVTQRSWAQKYDNQLANKVGIPSITEAAAVCVSSRIGLVEYTIQPKSIKSVHLIELMKNVRAKLKSRRVTVFMDNLRCHYNIALKEQLFSYGWKIIYNAPYSPQYHCIEQAFSVVKRRYKQTVIEKDYNLTRVSHLQVIRDSLSVISKQLIHKLERSHIEMMKRNLRSGDL